MTTRTPTLNDTDRLFLVDAFPGARILAIEENPEPWMPFTPRVRLALADGAETTIDFRSDITPERVRLLAALERAGIPGPTVIHGPVPDGHGGWRCLSAPPAGENLLLWALGGTPLRLRLATERAFEAIDRLQGATEALLADEIGATLPRRTLADEAEAIVTAGGPWLDDPWFQAALKSTRDAAREIHDPLVYTHYLHFFPNFVRIAPETGLDGDAAFGWPGDPRNQANPLAQFVSPFGHLGDPLLGLAMVWIYDCYPFVHTGFVEQFLWRRDRSRREFAPRLATMGLQTLQREIAPDERSEYASALRGWIDHARQDL